ncbi:MAG: antibiotic biosynthesis monooxygenase family protein [Bacteroidia bacterium]
MFVALSKFVVANGMTQQVKEAFINRPQMVENAAGYIKLDVISPVKNPDEIWLITYWEDEESYKTWHKSHMYHDSHKGIPKGLRLVPRSADISFFEYVCS